MNQANNPDLEKYLVLAQEMMRRIYADMQPDEIHRWLLEQLMKVGTAGNESAVLTWLDSIAYYDELLNKRIEQATLPAAERKILDWAWSTWNKMIDPLEPGLLAVIAAGDGAGKTIYGETQSEYWARNGRKVCFVHFELNRAVMLDRRAARHTLISRRELKSGNLNQAAQRSWHDARERLKAYDGQITYLHTPGWDMEKVVKQVTSHVEANECEVVVIDYLEKARPSSRQLKLFGTNHWQREADDVEVIKTFAEATETPVLLLAQMSKQGKTQDIDTIDRTAVRGAGEKTERANIVALLHRDKITDGYASTVDVRIDKNTLGPTGKFQQHIDGEHFRVSDLHHETNGKR